MAYKHDWRELEEMRTLATGQADSLKIDTGNERVWLCRCGTDDGMCCNHHITIERLENGRWVTLREECN